MSFKSVLRGTSIGLVLTAALLLMLAPFATSSLLRAWLRWTLRGEWLLLKNRSNQSLYDSNRQSLALKARYQY